MTYQEVYLMDNLTIESKAIYGMLCSYAGAGATAYPSVEFMCEKLKISERRFYTHMNLLIGAGVVKKKMQRSDGRRTNNIYVLTPNLQNLPVENVSVDFEQVENVSVENVGANNNTTKNNTINNNRKKSIISSEPDKSAPIGSGILLPLVDKTFYDVPVEMIALWKQAFPGVDVEQELRKIITWCNSNPKRKKTRNGADRFINNWLERAQNSGRSYQSTPTKEEPVSTVSYEPYHFDYSLLPEVELDPLPDE